MYYNKILRVWVVDLLDYFLLSAILGSILASCLKDYLSEKKSMERLKNSMIKKSKLAIKSNKPTPNPKEVKITKIYRFALGNRGGQFENFQEDNDFSNESFMLAQRIKSLVERLACFLKEQELRGVATIFFKSGRLFLELLLHTCKIDITYLLLTQELSVQVIVITSSLGGALGFTISWLSAAASLFIPPALISILSMRSVAQQIVNQRNYSKFKKLLGKILENDEIKETIRAYFIEVEVPRPTAIEIKPWHSNKNSLPKLNLDSDQSFEEFIKARMKDQLGLIENPSSKQIKEIIHKRNIKTKGKTIYFKDFVKKISENKDDIIDAEIVKEAIKVKVKNEEF